MNNRFSFLVSLCLLIGSVCLGQNSPQISVRISFNTETNRYEVVARPNFSSRNFAWGPSQVSVVLPAEIADQTLSIRSVNAGSWSDNSVVYGPAAAKDRDFHGITSQGEKLDLVAEQDYVLFDFGLKPGYVEQVRLFDNVRDPGSEQVGMKGGDFKNYMSDGRGTDYLKVDNRAALLLVLSVDLLAQGAPETTVDTRLVAYPNPSAGGTFRLFLKGFDPHEIVTVLLLNTNGVKLRSFTEKVETLAGREINAGSIADGYLLLNLERQRNQQRFSQKIWFR
ncbi:hypothetical protein [Fibrella aquatica]|uniref:hypothetical protein n=1 Tax=Fibrella aquatica TaxID=3242487 RepID=UPI003522C1AD